MTVSMVSVTLVTAAVGSMLTVMPPPLNAADAGADRGRVDVNVVRAASGTTTVPVVAPARMVMLAVGGVTVSR